jgi:hypothetical protein
MIFANFLSKLMGKLVVDEYVELKTGTLTGLLNDLPSNPEISHVAGFIGKNAQMAPAFVNSLISSLVIFKYSLTNILQWNKSSQSRVQHPVDLTRIVVDKAPSR